MHRKYGLAQKSQGDQKIFLNDFKYSKRKGAAELYEGISSTRVRSIISAASDTIFHVPAAKTSGVFPAKIDSDHSGKSLVRTYMDVVSTVVVSPH